MRTPRLRIPQAQTSLQAVPPPICTPTPSLAETMRSCGPGDGGWGSGARLVPHGPRALLTDACPCRPCSARLRMIWQNWLPSHLPEGSPPRVICLPSRIPSEHSGKAPHLPQAWGTGPSKVCFSETKALCCYNLNPSLQRTLLSKTSLSGNPCFCDLCPPYVLTAGHTYGVLAVCQTLYISAHLILRIAMKSEQY